MQKIKDGWFGVHLIFTKEVRFYSKECTSFAKRSAFFLTLTPPNGLVHFALIFLVNYHLVSATQSSGQETRQHHVEEDAQQLEGK